MLDLLLERPSLASLSAEEARLVQVLRLWAMMQGASQCPTQAVAVRLGSQRAAAHLHLLLEDVAAIWPDPFAVGPLCCRRLSHDEALFADMLRLGRTDDQPAFDRLLEDMIPADERERLFVSAKALSRSLPQR
jgi:hypothetical protein